MNFSFEAVLFDLDGTLIDSAPDLASTANLMREQQGLPHLPFEQLRSFAGMGARGMLNAALNIDIDHPQYPQLRHTYLELYEAHIMQEGSSLFDGMAAVIDAIEQTAAPWGIVTNKLERYARLLINKMPELARTHVLIGGDTTPEPKPSPLPLLEAARQLGVNPTRCIYIGDDQRDIVAGAAAGMRTVACSYGYLSSNAHVECWNADEVIHHPHELLNMLGLI